MQSRYCDTVQDRATILHVIAELICVCLTDLSRGFRQIKQTSQLIGLSPSASKSICFRKAACLCAPVNHISNET